ncbi:MAG: glycosyltransferase family 2 protein, partial [Actinomycetota bacterium]
MPTLRILGGLAALSFLAFQILRYRRRQVSRLNLIITCALCIVVVALAISPSFFNPVVRTFNFQPPNNRPEAEARTRLIFVLVVAVVILFALYLRLQSSADTNERAIRLLVEALGQERFDWERAASLPEGPRLVTVSPAYNEAENVAAVIKAMPDMVEGYHVVPVVVSDGSEDRTAAVARAAGAFVAELPIRRGGGLALRVGYEVALKMGADIVVTLDADGQHLPEELGVMIAPIVSGEADYVNGSRLLGYFEKESAIRHLGVHFFSRLVTILTGTRVTDISSGYRAARADLLRPLVLEQDQFWTSEILIEALR